MKKAKLVKHIDDWISDARLYRLSTPLQGNKYVIVSAVVAFGSGAETYIFPADKDGNALNMLELEGSFRGALDHAQALENAGYQIEA